MQSAISYTYSHSRLRCLIGNFVQVRSIYLGLQTKWLNTTLSNCFCESNDQAYPIDVIQDVHLLAQGADRVKYQHMAAEARWYDGRAY